MGCYFSLKSGTDIKECLVHFDFHRLDCPMQEVGPRCWKTELVEGVVVMSRVLRQAWLCTGLEIDFAQQPLWPFGAGFLYPERLCNPNQWLPLRSID